MRAAVFLSLRHVLVIAVEVPNETLLAVKPSGSACGDLALDISTVTHFMLAERQTSILAICTKHNGKIGHTGAYDDAKRFWGTSSNDRRWVSSVHRALFRLMIELPRLLSANYSYL